jgi:hypothetical protein
MGKFQRGSRSGWAAALVAVVVAVGCVMTIKEMSIGAGGTAAMGRMCASDAGFIGVEGDNASAPWAAAFVDDAGKSTGYYKPQSLGIMVFPTSHPVGACGKVLIRNLSKTSTLRGKFTAYLELNAPDDSQLGVPVDEVTDPEQPVPTSDGLWLSKAEIMALPASGTAWNAVRAEAYAGWGTADLSDNNSTHDTSTLAGALVGVRLNDEALKQKTRSAIMSSMNSGYARVLELSRNITSYVIAADLVGLSAADDAKFRTFVGALRFKALSGHSGGDNMHETALMSANNWGGMARAASTAISLYLGDTARVNELVTAQRAFLGEDVASDMTYTSTNWHASQQKAGINRRGATISGKSVDGVIPEDQRRTGEFTWPAPKGSYPWEALQGALVTSTLLSRARKLSIHAGDDALVRAFAWLYFSNNNPASNDDKWQPWLLNKLANADFAAAAPAGFGKNMGWTDWTHQ